MTLLETQGTAQIVIFCTVGILSIIGCFLYLYCYFFLQSAKSYARRLLACIAFSEMVMTFWLVAGMIHMKVDGEYSYYNYTNTGKSLDNCSDVNYGMDSTQFCQIQAFIQNYFAICSFVYNAGLALFMLQLTAFEKPSKHLFYAINFFAWVIPTCACIAVARKGLYGYSICTTGGWCWIRVQKDDNNLWMTIGGKLWEQGAELIMISSYIALKIVLVYKNYQCRKKGATQDVIQKLQSLESIYLRLLWVPILFTCCYLFGTLRSFILINSHATVPQAVSTFLSFMHGVGNNAVGLCNFIIFVMLQKSARNDLKKEILRACNWLSMGLLCCKERHPKTKRPSTNSKTEKMKISVDPAPRLSKTPNNKLMKPPSINECNEDKVSTDDNDDETASYYSDPGAIYSY